MLTRGDTTFVALPVTLRRPITGGCACAYCAEHPHNPPQWDTLAIATAADGSENAWTVHMPELPALEAEQRKAKRREHKTANA